MSVTQYCMAEGISSAAEQMSRWLDRVLGPDYHRFRPREAWNPSVNLYEDATCFYLVVDLAGTDPQTIDLGVEKGRLVLRGNRPVPRPGSEASGAQAAGAPMRLHLMEIDHGPFMRALQLPELVAGQKIEAQYRNGFLWVKMPKKT